MYICMCFFSLCVGCLFVFCHFKKLKKSRKECKKRTKYSHIKFSSEVWSQTYSPFLNMNKML